METKLCECGCGNYVKSLSVRFLPGHCNRSPEVKERKRQAMLLKYGVDNPSKCKEIQDKKIQTSMERYGTESPNQSKDVKETKRQSCQIKYGVDNPNQLESIKEKKVRTNLKNRGTEYPIQALEVQSKAIETCQTNYGVDHPYQSDEIRLRGQKTLLDNLGVDNASKSIEVKQKKLDTNINHWGFPTWSQSKPGLLFHRENAIERIENQRLNNRPLMPCIGNIEQSCLDELESLITYKIIRNKKYIGYYPDGYISELNFVIEFDEQFHTWEYQKNRDIKKDSDYFSYGITFFRITERNWKDNKEETIQNFLCVIKGLEDIKNLQVPSIV